MTNTDSQICKPVVCAVSASDSYAHAGQQCDLRVIQDLNCHGVSAISGVTAQNNSGVQHVERVSDGVFSAQIEALQSDISIRAIKIGLLLSHQQIEILQAALSDLSCPLIVDPVLASSSGHSFQSAEITHSYRQLLPRIDLFTPNIPEAEQLLERTIASDQDVIDAARQLRQLGAKAVLLKGGHRHSNNFVCDYFDSGHHQFWLCQPKKNSLNTRGTGCTLASAAASFMAQGKNVEDAVVLANAYVQQGIRLGFPLPPLSKPQDTARAGLLGNDGWPDNFDDYPRLLRHSSKQELSARISEVFSEKVFARCDTRALGLYPIVDSLQWLERLLKQGVETLQLRVKVLPASELEELVAAAIALGHQFSARLFINDHWQLAIKHGAYGVHLGQEDLEQASLDMIQESGLRLGLSSHSEFEWLLAASHKPSYIAMGSVFKTGTKQVKTIGLENLRRWSEVLSPHFPLVAIGGITEDNIDQVIACGPGSCALISTITGSDNYAEVTQKLQKKIKQSIRE